MPVIVKVFARHRLDGGRPGPQIVVQGFRDGGGRAHLADAGARPVVEAVGVQDLAQLSLAGVSKGLADTAAAARPVRRSDNAIVLGGRFDHLAAFENIVRGRFLHEHILAGLAGPNRCQRVPVVRGGDDDGIDVLGLQQPAHVGVAFDFLAAVPELLYFRVQMGPLRVAQRNDADARNLAEGLDLLLSLSADFHAGAHADDGQADIVVRPEHPGKGRDAGRHGRHFEEVPSRAVNHHQPPFPGSS